MQLPGRVQFRSARFSQVSLPGTRQFQIVPNPRSISRLSPTLELHFQTVPSLRSTSKLCPAREKVGASKLCAAREKRALPNCGQPTKNFETVPNPRAALPNYAQLARSGHIYGVPSPREAGASNLCPTRAALPNHAQPASCTSKLCRTYAALPNCAQPARSGRV